MLNKEKMEQIGKLLKQGQYEQAFETLKEFPLYVIADYLPEKSKSKPIEYWLVFIDHFYEHPLFKSEWLYPILNKFWWSFDESTLPGATALAEKSPSLFINSLRLNKVFLNETKFGLLKQFHQSANDYIRKHFLFMNLLLIKENDFKQRIQLIELSLSKEQPVNVMADLAFWYESKRALLYRVPNIDKIQSGLHELVETINLFLPAYFSSERQIDYQGDLVEQSIKRLTWHVKPQNPFTWQCLNVWLEYNIFLNRELYLYCYNLHWEVEIMQHEVCLKSMKEEDDFKWQYNGMKLHFWLHERMREAADFVETEVYEERMFIPGKNDDDYNMNYIGAIHKYATHCVADDMVFDLETNQLSKCVIPVWYGFYANAYGRYVSKSTKYLMQKESWVTTVGKVLVDTNGKGFPMRWMRPAEFEKMIKANLRETEISFESIYNLLVMDVSKPGNLRKFNIAAKPFIKIGNWICGFDNILGESSTQVGLIDNLMRINSEGRKNIQKEETSQMEKKLAELFRSKGFKAVESKETNTGEIDVLVYENGHLLLIELKRGALRVSMEEVWTERMNLLQHASIQVQRIKEEILQENSVISDLLGVNIMESPVIFPLIVSSSFEADHELLEGVKKISLFELRKILLKSDFDAMRNAGNNPILEIKKMLEANWVWRHLVTTDDLQRPTTVFYSI